MEVALLGVVVVDVLATVVVQIRPDEPLSISCFSAVEVSHSPQSVCANDDASANMISMSVTLETSHLERSLLNDDADANIPRMVVTLETSHLEMSPLNELAL